MNKYERYIHPQPIIEQIISFHDQVIMSISIIISVMSYNKNCVNFSPLVNLFLGYYAHGGMQHTMQEAVYILTVVTLLSSARGPEERPSISCDRALCCLPLPAITPRVRKSSLLNLPFRVKSSLLHCLVRGGVLCYSSVSCVWTPCYSSFCAEELFVNTSVP